MLSSGARVATLLAAKLIICFFAMPTFSDQLALLTENIEVEVLNTFDSGRVGPREAIARVRPRRLMFE